MGYKEAIDNSLVNILRLISKATHGGSQGTAEAYLKVSGFG